MKVKMILGIGFPNAKQEEVIDVDDDDYNACKTQEEREDLLHGYWMDWSNNYIDGGWVIEDE